MQIILKAVSDLKPYERNPRKNDEAVKYVAESIKEFGFKVPLVIDSDDLIVAGPRDGKRQRNSASRKCPVSWLTT